VISERFIVHRSKALRAMESPMSPFSRRLLGLCLVPVLVWSVDCTLTLCGQSEGYWAGIGTPHTDGINALHNYGSSVNEVSPTSRYLLTLHPLAYVAGTVFAMLVLCALIALLPAPLALVTCLAATFGHTWGATTWLSWFQYSYQLGNGFFLAVAVLLAVGIQTWYAERPPQSLLFPRMRLMVRWLLIGLLSILFIYLHLWPRVR
jgi:hypothetical protein